MFPSLNCIGLFRADSTHLQAPTVPRKSLARCRTLRDASSCWWRVPSFLFCAQTCMCLVSARPDGPVHGDNQSTIYCVPHSHGTAGRLGP